eukprot:4932344-Pyramimonas_sp.AAC.1
MPAARPFESANVHAPRSGSHPRSGSAGAGREPPVSGQPGERRLRLHAAGAHHPQPAQHARRRQGALPLLRRGAGAGAGG